MSSCKEIKAQLPFYLDDELHGDDKKAFESHMDSCANCRKALGREQVFLDGIRDVGPLYDVPLGLQARIEPILNQRTAPTSPSSTTVSLQQPGLRFLGKISRTGWMSIAASVVILFVLTAIYATRHREILKPGRISDFAMLAVDTHLRHLRNQLPFEIETSSPEMISEWFVGKVPFSLKLPNYQESSGQEKLYQLEGARLVGFNKDYAAYVAYQMRGRPITLVVASSSVALPSEGEQIVSKGITFHYDSIDGLKVITWTDRGLTYALVSDLEERGQQSCLVCHAGTKDRDFIEKLKPAR
jgi:anti-sigma factor RsiW